MDKQTRDISTLHNWEHNPRTITKDGLERLKKQLNKLGQYKPLLITEDGTVLGGNMRLHAMQEMGIKDIWVAVVDAPTEEKKIEYALSDNDRVGKYEGDQLANLIGNFPDVEWGDFSVDLEQPIMIDDLIEKYSEDGKETKSLEERFIIPPFSIFDTRQGYWQNRKRSWLSLGIESELGRGEPLTHGKIPLKYGANSPINKGKLKPEYTEGGTGFDTLAPQTSVFDPVLCEIINTWFNVKNGTVLDPFAGGSVRGIIAEKLGHKYTGIDLSERQIVANRENAKILKVEPNWIIGDSNSEIDKLKDDFDMIFSCPPYMDLEKYTDNPKDISNMDIDSFNNAYRSIIKKSIGKLKDNRFAIFVVSEVRGKNGSFKGLVPNTINFFENAGVNFYNEIILVNVAGTLPIRINKQFNGGRKVGRMHQNILVFYKGDPKKIKENYGEIDLSEVEELLKVTEQMT